MTIEAGESKAFKTKLIKAFPYLRFYSYRVGQPGYHQIYICIMQGPIDLKRDSDGTSFGIFHHLSNKPDGMSGQQWNLVKRVIEFAKEQGFTFCLTIGKRGSEGYGNLEKHYEVNPALKKKYEKLNPGFVEKKRYFFIE